MVRYHVLSAAGVRAWRWKSLEGRHGGNQPPLWRPSGFSRCHTGYMRYRVYPGEDQVHVVAMGKEITAADRGTSRDIGRHPVAEMLMERAKEVPNFGNAYPQGSGHNGYSWQWNESHGNFSGHESDYAASRTPAPTELLTHQPPQISYAYADPRLRAAVPTMVGLALQHDPAGVASGKIMADATLSEHSSKLSRRAAGRGLPVVGAHANPSMEGDGYTDFPDRTMRRQEVEDRYPIEATPEQIGAARTWVRSQLRPKRGTLPQPVPEPTQRVIQPALFDENGKGGYEVSEAAQGLTATGTQPGWKSMAKVHDK